MSMRSEWGLWWRGHGVLLPANLVLRGLQLPPLDLDAPSGAEPLEIPPNTAAFAVVIPGRDHPELLRKCLASLLEARGVRPTEILFVDNGSSPSAQSSNRELCERFGASYHYSPGEFNFASINNKAASQTSAPVLIFLNDDVEVPRSADLGALASAAALAEVGAVGARLLYPAGQVVQHAGITLLRNGPSNTLQKSRDSSWHHGGWLRGVYPVSAVTAACLAISRKNFEAVGGFDENLPVAYNDVDLCLRLNKLGLQTVVRNDVRLVHHESMSRGNDLVDRSKREALARALNYLRDRHGRLWPDPFYPEGLDQHRPDFAPDWKARVHPVSYTLKKWDEPAPSSPQGRLGDLGWGIEEWSLADRVLKLEGWALDRAAGTTPVTVELLGFEAGRVRAYPCHRYPRIDAELELDAWFQGDRAGFYLNATFSKRAWARTTRWALRIGPVLVAFDKIL